MSTWTNKDGLDVWFGTTASDTRPDGVTSATPKTLVYKVADGSALGDTDTAAAAADAAFIPAGSVITKAYFYVTTVWTSGGAATLDIGLKQADGTNIDADGIDVDIAVTALDALGDTILCNGAYIADGDLTAVRLTTAAYPMFTYETAAFTAGAGTLVLEYIELED